MEWLRRNAAPLSEKTWNAIDAAAVAVAKQTYVARRIADFDGPRGWDHVAVPLGTFKAEPLAPASGNVRSAVPEVMLLTELRTDFTLSWTAIDIFERVGPPLEAEPVETAARATALSEDRLVFFGGSGYPGILGSTQTPRAALSDWSIPGRAVTDMLTAVQKLDEQGIKGPYEAVLSPDHYYSYLRSTSEGASYPAAKQLGLAIERVHSSPLIEGAVLFSTRGGDFVITVGGDFTIGYRWHDEKAVHLFCVETVAARLLTPLALCLLHPD